VFADKNVPFFLLESRCGVFAPIPKLATEAVDLFLTLSLNSSSDDVSVILLRDCLVPPTNGSFRSCAES